MHSSPRTVLTVTDNVSFGQSGQRSFYALTLERPNWESWEPGQFVMVRPNGWHEDLTWARPLSICRVTPTSLVLFFQVVGRGTSRMAELKAGDSVTLWGPLGHGFVVEKDTPTLLLAGGIGIAPFAGYTDIHPDLSQLFMLFGHRLPVRNYPAESLSQRIETELHQETSPQELEALRHKVRTYMEAYKKRDGLALACGPLPFLKMIWRYALELGLRTQLSLDQRMACGLGACLGCVTTTSKDWPDKDVAGLPVPTCTHGPVFWATEIDLDSPIVKGAC